MMKIPKPTHLSLNKLREELKKGGVSMTADNLHDVLTGNNVFPIIVPSAARGGVTTLFEVDKARVVLSRLIEQEKEGTRPKPSGAATTDLRPVLQAISDLSNNLGHLRMEVAALTGACDRLFTFIMTENAADKASRRPVDEPVTEEDIQQAIEQAQKSINQTITEVHRGEVNDNQPRAIE
jgi:hypothetical protein